MILLIKFKVFFIKENYKNFCGEVRGICVFSFSQKSERQMGFWADEKVLGLLKLFSGFLKRQNKYIKEKIAGATSDLVINTDGLAVLW